MSDPEKKDNVFLRIVKYLIPWKGDRPSEMIRKVVFVTAAVVLVVSLTGLLTDAVNKANDTRQNESLSELFHSGDSSGNTSGNPSGDASGDTSGNTSGDTGGSNSGGLPPATDTSGSEQEKEPAEIQEQFLPLLEINDDIVGWITIGGDEPFIDYPVMQCGDNSYYLSHNYKGEDSVSGAIFADYTVPITAESQPDNIILYGHNMMSGEYFAMLTRYNNYKVYDSKGLEWYKKYPTVKFSTLYKTSTYKIFAGMLVNTRESEGEVFDYINYHDFADKAAFDDFCANVLDRSTFYTPDVDLKYGDKLLTMSTCSFDYDRSRELRWVLFAREVREGESEAVDVSLAYENPDPLYFDYYYSVVGGSWGGRKWPAEYIQDYSY